MTEYAELFGRVVKIVQRGGNNKDAIFVVHTQLRNQDFTCLCGYFAPVDEGDAVYAVCSFETDKKYGQVLRFARPPFIQVSMDKDSILRCFIRVLRGTGFGNIKAHHLYDVFSRQAGGDDKVVAFISELAGLWNESKDEGLFLPYTDILSKDQMRKLMMWWFKNRSLRRLYLFGLTNREIDACKMSHDKIYEHCLTNPYKLVPLSIEKCDEILMRQNKVGTPEDRRCAQIVRKMYSHMEDKSWTGTPSRILQTMFPDLLTYLERLKKEYGVIANMHTAYLDYAYRVETGVAEKVDMLIRSTMVDASTPLDSKLRESANFKTKTLSDEQKAAVQGSLDNNISIITGAGGTGKCLDPNTPLLLFDGSIKVAKEIKVGDILMGDDSMPRRVMSICSGTDNMYEIRPSKGRPFTCNEPHVLTLRTADGNIIDMPLNEFMQKPVEFQKACQLYHVGIEYPERAMELHPAVVGIYIAVSNDANMCIPRAYKYNARKHRLALLASIIDVVGKVEGDHIDINLQFERLRNDVEYVALSLGYMATRIEEGIRLEGMLSDLPFHIDRQALIDTEASRVSFEVIPKGRGEYCGFTLDGNGRFLLSDFLVTHNTTIIAEIVHNLELRNERFAIAAFTGKAVARIREVIKLRSPSTLHRMIARAATIPKFAHLIIDEASMVTTELFYVFLKAFPGNYRITLVGDPNQLQPIGWGTLLEQLMKSGRVPIFRLSQNHRLEKVNGDVNGIMVNANGLIQIKEGVQDEDEPPFDFVTTDNFNMIDGNIEIVYDVLRALYNGGVSANDITIITPYNREIDLLNKTAQQIFNETSKNVLDSRGKLWCVRDRVMLTENNYEINVMNAEEGIVTEVSPEEIAVQFKDGATHYFKLEPTDTEKEGKKTDEDDPYSKELVVTMLEHSYVLSIHRSQGSEWPYVIVAIPQHSANSSFLNRNLIYTSITRAKKACWIVGDIEAFKAAAFRSPGFRCENLAERVNKIDISAVDMRVVDASAPLVAQVEQLTL